MSDENIGFSLDVLNFDWLILGTGFEESLYAAYLSKIAKDSILVIDLASSYSNNTKTMNFREFEKLPQELPIPSNDGSLFKVPTITLIQSSEKQEQINKEFALSCNTSQDFKYFNIDLMPKLLFSESPTVKLMQQADMDQYMDFKAVDTQYFFDSQKMKFQCTPTSKSDIFKCSFLSLQEKKCFFQLLHTLIKIYHKITNYEIDQNSTQEFDQNTNSVDDEIYQKYEMFREKQATQFLDQLISLPQKDKIYSIIFYSLCLQNASYKSDQILTTQQFVEKLGKFVKSMGIHSQAPFLYTNYGTGDISQGFSRIAAVYGGTYIISNKVKIRDIQNNIEDGKISVQTNLNQQPLILNKGIIMQNQIYQSYIQKKPEQSDKQLFRSIIITTKNINQLKENVQKLFLEQDQEVIEKNNLNPSIYVIPCKIFSKHPIYIIRLDNSTNSTHKFNEVFYVKTLVDHQDIQTLKQVISYIIENMDLKYMESEHKTFNYICYEQHYVQDGGDEIKFQPNADQQIFVASADTFDNDFDEQSECFKKNIKSLSTSVNEGYYLIPAPGEQQLQKVEDQEQDHVSQLLNQIEGIIKPTKID